MAGNTLLTIAMISRDAAIVLGNTLDLAKRVNRDYDNDFGVKYAQIGQTLSLRRPIRPTIRVGSAVDIQAVTETYSQLVFYDPVGTDYALTSQELTFSIEDYFDKVVEPSVQRIASQIEFMGQSLLTQIFGAIGTPGTALTGGSNGSALPAITKALALLNKNLAPAVAGRTTLLNDPDFNGILATSNLTYFNPGPEISKIYTSGYQGDFSSFRVFMNQLVQSHTNGTYSGTPVVATTVAPNSVYPTNGVNSSVVSTSGFGNSDKLNVGDIITFGSLTSAASGVFMVNGQTKQTIGTPQQFAVQAFTNDGSGNCTITVTPAIITSGGFQNVSQAPQSGYSVNVLGASGATTQNALAFDRDCFVLAAKELMPYSVGLGKTTTDDQTRIPIRVQQMPDIRTNQEILRFDAMVAWTTLYSQLGVRICTT